MLLPVEKFSQRLRSVGMFWSTRPLYLLAIVAFGVGVVGVLASPALAQQQPQNQPTAPSGQAAAGQQAQGQAAPSGQPATQNAPAGTPQAAQPSGGQGQPTQPAAAQQPQAPPGAATQPAGPPTPARPAVKYDELSDYKDTDERTWTRQRSQILSLLRDGNLNAQQQQTVRNYMEQYALARWTVAENFSKLPAFRYELFQMFYLAKGKPAYSFLRQVVFDFMKRIATNSDGNYHPAARFNAVLTIASLNESEGQTRLQPPTPFAPGLDFVLGILEDDNQPDYLKVAALLGLRRHAVLGIADQQTLTNRVMPLLVNLASTKVPPAGRSAEGHRWMRARALEIIGILRPNADPQLVNMLVDIVKDPVNGFLVRCEAARTLGMLNYDQVQGVDVTASTSALVQLASDVCDEELRLLDEELEKEAQMPQPSPYGPYQYPMEEEMQYPEEQYYPEELPAYAEGMGLATPKRKKEEVEDKALTSRRRVKARLNPVFVAITSADHHMWRSLKQPMNGLAKAADTSTQPVVQTVLERVKAILDLCDQKQPDKQQYREKLEQLAAELRQALGGAAPATTTSTQPVSASPGS